VADGGDVAENQVLAFIKQMKMELEVRSPRSGRVTHIAIIWLQFDQKHTFSDILLFILHLINPFDPTILPLSGKLIEILVADGGDVAENQVLAFIKQMKMELSSMRRGYQC
jgi:acetyl/propionyl-CoA carboxylase alpha subunit